MGRQQSRKGEHTSRTAYFLTFPVHNFSLSFSLPLSGLSPALPCSLSICSCNEEYLRFKEAVVAALCRCLPPSKLPDHSPSYWPPLHSLTTASANHNLRGRLSVVFMTLLLPLMLDKTPPLQQVIMRERERESKL